MCKLKQRAKIRKRQTRLDFCLPCTNQLFLSTAHTPLNIFHILVIKMCAIPLVFFNILIFYLYGLYFTQPDSLRGCNIQDYQLVNPLVCLEVCFVSATLDLLCCSTEFPETVYRLNIHYVGVHITRNVRFHKFSRNSYSDFLSFIGCSHCSYDQFVSGPLKLLHRISKTLYGFGNHFLRIFVRLHLKSYCW